MPLTLGLKVGDRITIGSEAVQLVEIEHSTRAYFRTSDNRVVVVDSRDWRSLTRNARGRVDTKHSVRRIHVHLDAPRRVLIGRPEHDESALSGEPRKEVDRSLAPTAQVRGQVGDN